jgi:filamentous hemagglutinin family protein
MSLRRAKRGAFTGSASVIAMSALVPFCLATDPRRASAAELPQHGQFIAGAGTIATGKAGLTVGQSSANGIIDWNSFSIGKGRTVSIDNGSGATLNRVTGGSMSAIAGSLNATGSVYLINTQGVVITGTGKVLTGGSFVASSQNAAFANDGTVHYSGKAQGRVVNAGSITAANAGLDGGPVESSGTIAVTGGGHIWLTAAGRDSVSGSLVANGGSVALQGRNITMPGSIDVSTAASGAAGGTVRVIANHENTLNGSIRASGGSGGRGGDIETSAPILSVEGSRITAGKGGRWLLDPFDLTIDSSAAASINSSLNAGTSVVLRTRKASASGPGIVTSGPGDIIVDGALAWSTNARLTLDSYHSIFIDVPMSLTGKGGLAMLTNHGGSGGDLSFSGGNITFGNPRAALMIDNQKYMLVDSLANLAGDIAKNPSGYFALSGNYDASKDGVYATSPVPTIFSGTFEGLGNAIGNLAIDVTSSNGNVGLFSQLGPGGVIRDIGIINASVASAGGASANTGLLVGYNGSGTISEAYATGSVTGGAGDIGGLIGNNAGTVLNAYTDVVVVGSGPAMVGGLAGGNSGTVTDAYAMGAVVGANGASTGGLAAANTGTVTNGYWDTQTTGLAASAGGSGMATPAFQGALPSGFSANIWGTGPGLYPYFLSQFPKGRPQAISGFAFTGSGSTPLVPTTSGDPIVSLDMNGTSLGTVTTGANGYYYFLLAPFTIPAGGAAVIASTVADAATGSQNGAVLESATGSLKNFDIWGNTLIAPTSFTSYSQASASSLQTQDSALISQAVGSNTALGGLVSGLSEYGYLATGASFSIDTPLTLSTGLYVRTTASDANIKVLKQLIVPGNSQLALLASGSVGVNANITITGGGSVALAYNGRLNELVFANGHKISFTSGAASGAELSINGKPYTLVYDVQGLANAIAENPYGNFALAANYDATGDGTYASSPVSTTFYGIFEGLGNTISNLTIDSASTGSVGLFASTGVSASGGPTVFRDIILSNISVTSSDPGVVDVGGLVGSLAYTGRIHYVSVSGHIMGQSGSDRAGGLAGSATGEILHSQSSASVTTSGPVSGGQYGLVGGLVGFCDATIGGSDSTGSVSGAPGADVGGLAGLDEAVINNAFATGAVTGGNHADVGGLLGNARNATIVNSYASGATTGGSSANVGGLVGESSAVIGGSFASGTVTGGTGADIGGLVGRSFQTMISNSYATGAVAGGKGVHAGGLVGEDLSGSGASFTIGSSYASGAVSGGAGSSIGGLVGFDGGGYVYSDDYWDTTSSGIQGQGAGNIANVPGITGLTTVQLQSGLPTGFDPAIWAESSAINIGLPYLLATPPA